MFKKIALSYPVNVAQRLEEPNVIPNSDVSVWNSSVTIAPNLEALILKALQRNKQSIQDISDLFDVSEDDILFIVKRHLITIKSSILPITTSIQQSEKQIQQLEEHIQMLQQSIDKKKNEQLALTTEVSLYEQLLLKSKINKMNTVKNTLGQMFFGVSEWKALFGENCIAFESVIDIPQKIVDVLDKPCPFYTAKTVANTHFLFFLPKLLNGKAITLNYWDHLLSQINQEKMSGHPLVFEDHWWSKSQLADMAVNQDTWILMPRDIVPGSTHQNWMNQQTNLNANYPKYRPLGLLEAVSAIALYRIQTNERLFSQFQARTSPPSSDSHPMCVDFFGDAGIAINIAWSTDAHEKRGVGACLNIN